MSILAVIDLTDAEDQVKVLKRSRQPAGLRLAVVPVGNGRSGVLETARILGANLILMGARYPASQTTLTGPTPRGLHVTQTVL